MSYPSKESCTNLHIETCKSEKTTMTGKSLDDSTSFAEGTEKISINQDDDINKTASSRCSEDNSASDSSGGKKPNSSGSGYSADCSSVSSTSSNVLRSENMVGDGDTHHEKVKYQGPPSNRNSHGITNHNEADRNKKDGEDFYPTKYDLKNKSNDYDYKSNLDHGVKKAPVTTATSMTPKILQNNYFYLSHNIAEGHRNRIKLEKERLGDTDTRLNKAKTSNDCEDPIILSPTRDKIETNYQNQNNQLEEVHSGTKLTAESNYRESLQKTDQGFVEENMDDGLMPTVTNYIELLQACQPFFGDITGTTIETSNNSIQNVDMSLNNQGQNELILSKNKFDSSKNGEELHQRKTMYPSRQGGRQGGSDSGVSSHTSFHVTTAHSVAGTSSSSNSSFASNENDNHSNKNISYQRDKSECLVHSDPDSLGSYTIMQSKEKDENESDSSSMVVLARSKKKHKYNQRQQHAHSSISSKNGEIIDTGVSISKTANNNDDISSLSNEKQSRKNSDIEIRDSSLLLPTSSSNEALSSSTSTRENCSSTPADECLANHQSFENQNKIDSGSVPIDNSNAHTSDGNSKSIPEKQSKDLQTRLVTDTSASDSKVNNNRSSSSGSGNGSSGSGSGNGSGASGNETGLANENSGGSDEGGSGSGGDNNLISTNSRLDTKEGNNNGVVDASSPTEDINKIDMEKSMTGNSSPKLSSNNNHQHARQFHDESHSHHNHAYSINTNASVRNEITNQNSGSLGYMNKDGTDCSQYDELSHHQKLLSKKRKRMNKRREYEEQQHNDSSDSSVAANVLQPGKPVTLEDVLIFTKAARLVMQATPPFLVIHANAAYALLSGFDSHYAIGKPLSSLMSLPYQQQKVQTLNDKESSGISEQTSVLSPKDRYEMKSVSHSGGSFLHEFPFQGMITSSGLCYYHEVNLHACNQHLPMRRDQHQYDTKGSDSEVSRKDIPCMMGVSPVVSTKTTSLSRGSCNFKRSVAFSSRSFANNSKSFIDNGSNSSTSPVMISASQNNPNGKKIPQYHHHASSISTTRKKIIEEIEPNITHFAIQLDPIILKKKKTLSSNNKFERMSVQVRHSGGSCNNATMISSKFSNGHNNTGENNRDEQASDEALISRKEKNLNNFEATATIASTSLSLRANNNENEQQINDNPGHGSNLNIHLPPLAPYHPNMQEASQLQHEPVQLESTDDDHSSSTGTKHVITCG